MINDTWRCKLFFASFSVLCASSAQAALVCACNCLCASSSAQVALQCKLLRKSNPTRRFREQARKPRDSQRPVHTTKPQVLPQELQKTFEFLHLDHPNPRKGSRARSHNQPSQHPPTTNFTKNKNTIKNNFTKYIYQSKSNFSKFTS